MRDVTVGKVLACITQLMDKSGRKRCVLLLDDAALTLTPEYMIEFFDVFKNLKTKSVSPKASVYPGTTEYGPRFHVGHDAMPVEAWLSVDDPTYGAFMDSLRAKRLTAARDVPDSIIELFKYAAFGIPRAFIVLLASFLEAKGTNSQQRFNRVIDARARLIESEYRSLGKKMPQFATIVETGWSFFRETVEDLTKENSPTESDRKIVIGVTPSTNHKLNRMVRFLAEAGLFV